MGSGTAEDRGNRATLESVGSPGEDACSASDAAAFHRDRAYSVVEAGDVQRAAGYRYSPAGKCVGNAVTQCSFRDSGQTGVQVRTRKGQGSGTRLPQGAGGVGTRPTDGQRVRGFSHMDRASRRCGERKIAVGGSGGSRVLQRAAAENQIACRNGRLS